MKQLPADNGSKQIRPRKLRGLDSLTPPPPPPVPGGGSCWRGSRLQSVLASLGGMDIAGAGVPEMASESEPWWLTHLKQAAKPGACMEVVEDEGSGRDEDEWFGQQVQELQDAADATELLQEQARCRRRLARARKMAGRIVAKPAAERHARGEPWGKGRFALAPVYARGRLIAFSATCKVHVADGARCNSNLTLGRCFTLEQAEHRIKQWCVHGLQVPDGVGARKEHMGVRPRDFAEDDLIPLEEVERLAVE